MLENTLKPLLNGLILVMALFLAPLAGGTGLTTHQNHGKTYYYDGKQIPYYNSSRHGAWDRGSGYRIPWGDYGYHYDQGYSHGYHQPPYNYHGRAYYPYNAQTTHENTVPRSHGRQGYYQGYDQGYHDGYRDAPKPYSGGVIYLHKGTQW
ncbi:MAG: hypothetical protein ACREV4_15620 [Gammaproteobacteria bacterium]